MNARLPDARRVVGWLPWLVAVLALLVPACGSTSTGARHDPGTASGTPTEAAQPAPSAPPGTASVAASPEPGAALAAVVVIRQAYTEISGGLFRAIAARELLGPAWRAIAAETRRQGIGDTAVNAHEARGSDDIEAFERELTAFLQGTGRPLDPGRVSQAAVRAMAAAVGDSHTRFLTPEQADSQRRSAEGDTTYSGIGVRVDAANTIVEVFTNTPADQAGLRAGDRIVRVNGQDIAGMGANGVSTYVRGPEGTEVRLTILRAGEAPRDVTLNRARIITPTVVSRLLEPGIGYIRITSFPRRSTSVDAARDFDDQLRRLLDLGARGLVFDLRGNPGGDPFTSVAVASNFVADGPIFVSVNREGRRTRYPATNRPTPFHGPVAVLVDRGTASGAEVVSSALQEYGAGYVIGTRTCGCLSVGKPLQLGDSSGLVVTVEQALTGRLEGSLEGIGLEPDLLTTANGPSDTKDAQRDRAVAYLRAQLP